MSVREEFDAWAADGRDRGMEERHWHTAKHVLARMPVEPGETVLDLGTGSGYALRALADTKGIGRGYGLDGSPEMARNAREYSREADPATDLGGETGAASATDFGFVVGDFGHLPFADDSVDHAFTMEAFYYSADPHETLREVARVLRPGGTFHCAVNYYEENVHSHAWQGNISVEMTRWDAEQYREAFREAGLAIATQDNVPDREVEIPPAGEFPTENWESREAMVERYRTYGTLLTVGVAR
ncbi:class I SAM-dependent methyltransferase [Halorarum salinum]|uniref:Class I SAM-dependent methyltransferase n=1 Tax=Halorarum salinum TaxID=2743089 RepID=A0A7D5QBE1_9EURY|nr:class I SAM-dependent methyltransferase [Halobaculum salinum]QLG60921.1 class I SAM-dependent methyltransferase [Halobaculum salinum]